MKKIKLIIWDVDGTMLDTSSGIISSTKYMIKKLNLEMPSEKVVRSFVGPRIQDSLERVYGLIGEERDNAARIFRNHYKKSDVLDAKPYDGLEDVLHFIKSKGFIQMVATNKRQDFVDLLINKYELSKYFVAVFGTDMAGKYTKDDLLKMCIEKAKVCPEEAVLIGDSSYDAESARNVGTNFVAALYGYDFKNMEDVEKYHVQAAINNIKEIEYVF